jgi:hypothetical protein
MGILICSGLLYLTGWAAQPSEDISRPYGVFLKAEKPVRIFILMNMTGLKSYV